MDHVHVYDLFGQLVAKQSLSDQGSLKVNLTNIRSGIYVVKVYAANNDELYTTKIVKK